MEEVVVASGKSVLDARAVVVWLVAVLVTSVRAELETIGGAGVVRGGQR